MQTKKYDYTEKCREISGFGCEYEDACRKMVIAGMEWLDGHPEANPTFAQFKYITGVTCDENEDMNKMQEVMNKSIEDGVTGAMMQAATNHVLYAHKNGWDRYILEMEKPEENDTNPTD